MFLSYLTIRCEPHRSMTQAAVWPSLIYIFLITLFNIFFCIILNLRLFIYKPLHTNCDQFLRDKYLLRSIDEIPNSPPNWIIYIIYKHLSSPLSPDSSLLILRPNQSFLSFSQLSK